MKYLPDQVFIEYNGTWGMDTLTETELPRGWMVVQSLATVDAATFDMYLANMRTMIMEQLFQADVVIFNRCDDSTDKGKYRRNVKALNRKAVSYTHLSTDPCVQITAARSADFLAGRFIWRLCRQIRG